jgi:hypothetical protein
MISRVRSLVDQRCYVFDVRFVPMTGRAQGN